MNPKTTRTLVVLAVALFAFIFLSERHWPDTEQRRQLAQKLLPDFDPGQATGVEIDRLNQGTVRAEKKNGAWALTVPLAYPAAATRIETLLNDLNDLTRRAYLSASDLVVRTNGLAEFGLSPPQARVIVQQAGRSFELHLGAHTLVRDQVYVQVVGLEGVSVCDGAWLGHLPGSANDWRDTALLSLKGLAYNRLTVRTGARDFEAELDAGTGLWRLTRPMPARADSLVLNTLLSEFQNWQINRFVSDNPGADLESFGLQPPEIQISLGRGTNDLVRIAFGKSPADNTNLVYALQWRNTNVVLVAKDWLDALRDPFNIFRDRHLVSVETNAVDQIDVRALESFTLRRQPDHTWRVVATTTFPADPELVHEFLVTLDRLQIKEFVNDVATSFDFSSHGFAKPTRQYVLQSVSTNAAGGVTNVTLAEIEFGAEQADRAYVRRAPENSIYAIARGDQLPRAAFRLRDRGLWEFSTNDVVAFSISVRGQTRKCVRNAAGQWTLTNGASPAPVPLALEETLYRLGHLKAETWVAQGADQLDRYGFP
jgi:hypothetical protein